MIFIIHFFQETWCFFLYIEDCVYKDETERKIDQHSKQTQPNTKGTDRQRRRHRRRHRKRNGHRNRDHVKPKQRSLDVMAASDPSVHHVVYQSRDQQRYPQLPDAVARLVWFVKIEMMKTNTLDRRIFFHSKIMRFFSFFFF